MNCRYDLGIGVQAIAQGWHGFVTRLIGGSDLTVCMYYGTPSYTGYRSKIEFPVHRVNIVEDTQNVLCRNLSNVSLIKSIVTNPKHDLSERSITVFAGSSPPCLVLTST